MQLSLERSQVEVSRCRGFGDAAHDASFTVPELLLIAAAIRADADQPDQAHLSGDHRGASSAPATGR